LQPNAWKRVAPGEFVSLWDAETADPDAKLVVWAPGYAPYELDRPGAGTDPVEYRAELLRAGDGKTGTLILTVKKSGLDFVGARVRGSCFERSSEVGPGRTALVALSADGGEVVLKNLRPGPWRFAVDAEFDGAGWSSIVIAPGQQRLTVHLRSGPAHRGYVVDDRKRPIEGVVISVRGSDGRVARSRKDGRFALTRVRSRSMTIQLRATKAGYTTTYVDWVRKNGRWDRKTIVLKPAARLVLPIRWHDNATRPIPADLRFRLRREVGDDTRDVETSVYVNKGRVIVEHAPQATLKLEQIAGSAFAPTIEFKNGKSGIVRRPDVKLLRGATIRGTVAPGRKSGAFRLVSVRCRGHQPRVVRTDRNGNFEMRGVPPGKVAIEISGQTAASRNRNSKLEAVNGETLKVVVEF